MADSLRLLTLLLMVSGDWLLTNSKVLPDTNVTCIIQDDCILPCSFGPTGSVVIHWYKQQIPVHSFYYHKDQFGLQNKHFSGRTALFNGHIPQGNASLLLRRVKVQDRGRYKCYTSTRKGNQEIFINLEVKALIQSVTIEISDDTVTCSSHHIYPAPQVTWATDPPSAGGALGNVTTKTSDYKSLFGVESTLRIVGNSSNVTFLCAVTSADRSQVWTASQRNQEDITQEEGHSLFIPCVAPHPPHNFTLTWTLSSLTEPALVLRYDSRTRTFWNQWENQAEVDQDQLLLRGDGSLLLPAPQSREHSGNYTCTVSGPQSRHVVQTRVTVTVPPVGVHERSAQRSWWTTAASVAFVLFTVVLALPQCVRPKALESSASSHTRNGAGLMDGASPKASDATASYVTVEHGLESGRVQLHLELQEEEALGTLPKTTQDFTAASPPHIHIEAAGGADGPPVNGSEEQC